MGVVYKARQVQLNRLVALKMILGGPHAQATEIARFKGEATAIAQLQHTNIVQIYEVGDVRRLPFFSLEFVNGPTLAKKLAGTPQPPRPTAELVENLARAMSVAHQRGVIHRDLKPSNILLTVAPIDSGPRGSDSQADQLYGIPKITDFGLAKQIDSDSARLTRTGAFVGTPSYVAPEQAAGKALTQEKSRCGASVTLPFGPEFAPPRSGDWRSLNTSRRVPSGMTFLPLVPRTGSLGISIKSWTRPVSARSC
jgi:serine/threonine protein kinase